MSSIDGSSSVVNLLAFMITTTIFVSTIIRAGRKHNCSPGSHIIKCDYKLYCRY